MDPTDCCILNAGGGSWAFESLAEQLSRTLWVDVSDRPRKYNYLLLADDDVAASGLGLFIPLASIRLAADKRAVARAFATHRVPTPETRLVGSLVEAEALLSEEPGRESCVKYPTGCGASGHRMLSRGMALPDGWPTPLIVQEFIRMERPEVYRMYAAGGQLFGWVARRFPRGVKPSPWVAHVRGARYESAGDPPPDAVAAAGAALEATGLLASFGCVNLLPTSGGKWLVLEVGTDGMFNHVDRDLGLPDLERAIQGRIAEAFWARLGTWRPRVGRAWHARAVTRQQ